MIRDDVAIHNERMKLLAGSLNAVAVGLVAVGVLAPAAARSGAASFAAAPTGPMLSQMSLWFGWLAMGLAIHGAAHYILGHLKKAPSDDAD